MWNRTHNRFFSANTCSSTLLSTILPIFCRGMAQTTDSFSAARSRSSSSVWRSPRCPAWGCPWANHVAINLLSHKSAHSFLHEHNVIKRNPYPCSPGEVKAQAVRCFSLCSAHHPTGMALGNAFQGKAGQIHLAVTPCKACWCRSDEVLHRNIWLPSSWDKLAQAVVCSTQANQVKIRLGIVPPCCSPVMSPSLDAYGMPIRERLDGERDFRHIPNDSLTARLASVGVRSVVKYVPTCDRCMEN